MKMSDSYFPTDSLNAMNVETTVADAVSGENTSVKLGNLLNGYVVADENNQFRGLTDDSKNLSILTGESLPDYSEANDGDALIIEDGEPTWGAVDALPEIEEADEGKFLSVDQGEAVWSDAPSGLPEITNADEGKVLTVVDNSGTLEAEWAEPSGGNALIVNVLNTTPRTLDKTYAEIVSSIPTVIFKREIDSGVYGYGWLMATAVEDGMYMVGVYSPADYTADATYVASSADGILTAT